MYKRTCVVCNKTQKLKGEPRSDRCRKCTNDDMRHGKNPKRLGTGKYKNKFLEKNGYFMVSKNGKKYYEHRLIMEKYLGRELEPSEHIHHKNHDRTDNRLENLEIVNASEHARHHMAPRAKEMSVKGHIAKKRKRDGNLSLQL